MRLDEQGRSLGVDPAGEQEGARGDGPLAELVRGPGKGHGMEIHDAEERIVLVLLRHPVAHRPQVVAEVEVTGGLDAAEDALPFRH
jgi:hypothetical protein